MYKYSILLDEAYKDKTCFHYHEMFWYRGKNQRQRAIEERINKYGIYKGFVISMSEFKSNAQMSTTVKDVSAIINLLSSFKPEERCLFELIEDRSKLYFDVDVPPTIKITKENVLNNIMKFLNDAFGIIPTKQHILTAHRFDKLSWHIIFPEFYITREDRKNLSDYILEYSIPFVDHKVYNKTQCFRMKGCCIRNRPETILLSDSSLKDTLVTTIIPNTKHLQIIPISQKRE
tara:strand:+ start:13737 stop:14432 length:696 start_codon:yes stop_codon:yes gene_type:complete